MEKFKLAIGIHNHQPVGNFDSVFEQAHKLAYMPFLQLFDRFENLKMSLHQSGILWKWQEKRYPKYFDLVQKLVYEDRLELMTGGFYEPILSSIPDRDKLGQIEMLSRYVEGQFGVDTTGLWVTERVWEPHLPKILKEAGVEYVPIDDTHFLYAGFELDQLKGVFLTEEQGLTIKLLPIQKTLRYLIPFRPVEKVIEELKRQAEENPDGLAIYADDGEKFGVWPKTHQHCYKDKWLSKFFDALAANSNWLEVITLGRASATRPVGRAYLPTASYAEMLHWSLPPQAFAEYEEFEKWLKETDKFKKYGRFVRGGHWRGFLAKYDEANIMHKRMLLVSDKLEEYIRQNPTDFETIDKARHHLYAAQCNCPYWHGVFGGLYLAHIRQAIYENIIKAERLLTPALERVRKEVFDYDCDGYDEVLVTTNKFKSIIKPSNGGMLVELDNFEAAFNVTDTLTRRMEGYHRKLSKAQLDGEASSDETASIHDLVLTKEKGLDKLLAYDWYLRRCFIDHFFKPDTDINKFMSGEFGDDGDFILEPWRHDDSTNPETVRLTRQGHLWREDGVKPLTVKKSFYFGPESEVISVNYNLTVENEDIKGVRFGIENNFNFLAGHAHDRYILFGEHRPESSFLDSVNVHKGFAPIIIRDDWSGNSVVLLADREAEFWQVPIFTISLSEGGFEKVYQGTSIVSIFDFDLKKGKPLEIALMLFSGKYKSMPPRFLFSSDKTVIKDHHS
jgi:hypothetical protein